MSTMMSKSMDPEIVCFQHCDSTNRIFCLELPDSCPICSTPLATPTARTTTPDSSTSSTGASDSESTTSTSSPIISTTTSPQPVSTDDVQYVTAPFVVPFPFMGPSQSPCSLLIRPTKGDFLHNYRNASDLHIGVTDSQGNVFEFDHRGVRVMPLNLNGHRSWMQSLVVPITEGSGHGTSWSSHWDYVLNMVASMDDWEADNYHDTTLNCYSFVMTFLKMLRDPTLRSSLASKTTFCQDFVLPRTRVAAKYIALYRQVIRDGVSMVPSKGVTSPPSSLSPPHSKPEVTSSKEEVSPVTQVIA